MSKPPNRGDRYPDYNPSWGGGLLGIATLLTTRPSDLIASLRIWEAMQSTLGIVCCCAPVCRPLIPSGLWARIASKARTCRPRFKSKRGEKVPASQGGPWRTASPDSYLQEEGTFYTGGHANSTRCLVAGDAQGGASYSKISRPVGSMQVGRRIGVDYPAICQTSEQEVDYLPETSQPSVPRPTHSCVLRMP